jgi:hypothetical protein
MYYTESISTSAQYVVLHWNSWMRYSSQIQQIHWKIAVTLEKCTAFRESPRRALEQSNIYIQIIFIDCSPIGERV